MNIEHRIASKLAEERSQDAEAGQGTWQILNC